LVHKQKARRFRVEIEQNIKNNQNYLEKIDTRVYLEDKWRANIFF